MAATLHELAVMHVKRRELGKGEELLRESLALRGAVTGGEDAGVSATLYQLAVVATLTRPPRLDEADSLLQRVLSIEEQPGAARAMTLQQLGRVALRRGNLDRAEAAFNEALVGLRATYLSDMQLNVAGVQEHLGNVALLRQDYSAADTRFAEALRIVAQARPARSAWCWPGAGGSLLRCRRALPTGVATSVWRGSSRCAAAWHACVATLPPPPCSASASLSSSSG